MTIAYITAHNLGRIQGTLESSENNCIVDYIIVQSGWVIGSTAPTAQHYPKPIAALTGSTVAGVTAASWNAEYCDCHHGAHLAESQRNHQF